MTETIERVRSYYQFDMDQIRQWYEKDGESVRQIAARLEVSVRTMWRHMNAAGIAMRPPGGQTSASPRRRWPPARPAAWTASVRGAEGKVRESHAAGLRGRQIDALYGWKRGRAGRIQKRLGLDPARPAPPPAELRALYDRLGTAGAVAEHLGRSRETAAGLLKDAGVTLKRPPRPPHPLDAHEEALRQARAGEKPVPLAELAAQYGVTGPALAGYLQARGIVAYRIVTMPEHDEIVRLRGEGLSCEEIGRRLGRPSITIRKQLDESRLRPRLK